MTQDVVNPNGDVILRAEQITKIYPGTVALDKVDFNIYRGKVNALIGENGAGKSTLMKILAGVERATEGRLLLNGKEIAPQSTREAESLGIGIIYQELNLFPNLSVAENIFMAHELTQRGIVIKKREQEERARELLQRLEQDIDPRALVMQLRIGQQQIVEIAKALALDVNILIMDEPTSALSNTEVEVLFRVIRELRAQGVSIVYISHKLEELMQISDFVTILRDGQLIAEAPRKSIDLPWIVQSMVGRKTATTYTPLAHTIGEPVLRVENLTLERPGGVGGYLINDVSLTLHAGEILGVYGLMGAGRTELFEALIGLYPQVTGKVWLDGKEITGSSRISERIEHGLMLIPEDRQREGLVQPLSVAHNMTLASLNEYLTRFYISTAKEHRSVNKLIKDLNIKVSSANNIITSLSGGNQQKVVVAKALLTSPRVLMMDEPTRGIDVGAKEEIFEIISKLAQEGLGILFVSTELKEVMAISDRILAMSKGVITREFTRAEATEQALVEASAIGHGISSASVGV